MKAKTRVMGVLFNYIITNVPITTIIKNVEEKLAITPVIIH